MLYNAIPKSWRIQVKQSTFIFQPESLNWSTASVFLKDLSLQKNVNKITTKEYYWSFIRTKFIEPWVPEKWNRILNLDTDCNWSELWYNRIIAVTKERKLSNFMYKFIHDILPHGLNLYRWKITQTSLCTICMMTNDIFHMFIMCQRVKLFWREFQSFLLHNFHFRVEITMKTLLCGLTNQDKNVNLLLIIAMFTIYKSWMLYKGSNELHKMNIFELFMTELRIRREHESVSLH